MVDVAHACALCRRPIEPPAGVLFDHLSGQLQTPAGTVRLPPGEADIFEILHRNWPNHVPADRLFDLLNGAWRENRSRGTMKVQLSKLRRHLAAAGIAVETIRNGYDYAYRLDIDTAAPAGANIAASANDQGTRP